MWHSTNTICGNSALLVVDLSAALSPRLPASDSLLLADLIRSRRATSPPAWLLQSVGASICLLACFNRWSSSDTIIGHVVDCTTS